MTLLKQMEFDFMKDPEVANGPREVVKASITEGWGGTAEVVSGSVSSESQAFMFFREHGKKYPGYHENCWMFTDCREEGFAVVDFGNHTFFGRIDYAG